MLRKTVIALCSLAMLAATFAAQGAPLVQAQTDPGLRVVTELTLSNSREVKYPAVIAGNDFVHVAGNINRENAVLWSKAASASSFPNPFELGPAEGQPDFSSTALAKGPDGSIYVAWINNPARTVFMRRRDTAGNWGPTRVVDRGSSFPYKPAIGVSSTGQIWVAWLIPDRPARYTFSTDGGANWAGDRDLSDVGAFNSVLGLAGGPGGSAAITFTAGSGGRLQIFVGLWSGSAFTIQRVTPSGSDYADSSVSIAPDGKVYVAYRGVAESGGNAGMFYAERQADGSWPRSRLAGGPVSGTASVNADEGGNLHFSWLAQVSGANQVFYAFKPSTSAPRGPVGSGRRGAIFNARGYGSVGTGAYNHAVAEEFTGAGLRTLYSLFQANVVTFGAQPVIENDAPRTARSGDSSVLVTFNNVTGSPNQVRFAWNRAPNDADPWLPFAASMRIPVPDSIYGSVTCEASTLFTQLRNTATNQIETQPRSDTVQIDGVVEAVAFIDNAIERSADADVNQLANVSGAPGGAPNYARVPLVYLDVDALTDCNGLVSLGVGSTPGASETTYPIGENGFEGIVPLPNLDDLQPGVETPFYVRVTDGAGNVRVYEFRVTIDEGLPVLNAANPGTGAAAANALGDILQDLTFTNLNIRDDVYRDAGDPDPNRRFWGFWIANSPDPVADPVGDPNLNWTVVEAPRSVGVPDGLGATSYTVTLKGWSLAAGLTRAQQAPGDFYIYIRFLDGAGNATDDYLTLTVASSQMQLLESSLPLVTR